jgi:hypothetical protein
MLTRPLLSGLVALSVLGILARSLPAAEPEWHITDAHIHYSQDAWDPYPPDTALAILDRAGIRRAFVSSTPDDGTLRLYERAPDRIVPVLRPYRGRGDLGSWHRDPTVVPYLRERMARGIHRGIGEFHLYGDEARSAVVAEVAALAAQHRAFLHCHCDAAALEGLLGIRPDVQVLWAHAGMSSGPDAVGRLLDGYGRRLWVELALRSDVAPGGRLDPAWRALFLKHPDRFLLGTDTWIPSRWGEVGSVQDAARTWLRQLPPDVARRIARDNADGLLKR